MRKWLILLIISLSSVFAQNWIIEPVDSNGVVYDCSIAVDAMNYPHIAYCYRQDLGGNWFSYWVKYAQWNGIAWDFQPVETTTAFNRGGPIFISVKLRLDNQNHPHIAYIKDSVPFKYAYHNGDSWQISPIESCSALLINGIDMVLSEAGIPHISYSFIDFNNSTHGVRYAFKNGDSWIIRTVWTENRTQNTAIDLDRSGFPVIALADIPSNDTGHLYCARFNGQKWRIDTVHWMTNQDYQYSVFSIKVSGPDRIHIFYKRSYGVFHAVSQGDSWAIEFIDINGLFEAGGDMILDGDKPNVVYSSVEDLLTFAYKVDTLWNYEIIEPREAGLYPSIVRDNRENLHVSYVYPFYSVANDCLFYARKNSPAIAGKEVRSMAELKALIEIYPNPAKSFFVIRCPLPVKEIEIFDVSGKLIREITLMGTGQEIKIPLKGIKPGIYFLQLGKETKKFIVAK